MSPRLPDRPLLILVLLKYAQFPIVQIILTRVGQVIRVRRCRIAKIPRRGTGVKPSVSQEKLAVRGMKQRRLPNLLELCWGERNHIVILPPSRGAEDDFSLAKAVTEA